MASSRTYQLPLQSTPLPFMATGNITHHCNNSVGCSMDSEENGKLTTIALIRLVASILSIIGTMSIILSALIKLRVKSSKVHPIFVLSIADFLLAVLWVIGGIVWLKSIHHHRVWCFAITLMTVILECIAINLTFVYALYAYAHLKHTNLNSLITNYFHPTHGWSKLKVIGVYALAWLLPTILVMVPFTWVACRTNLLNTANSCSCWCAPKFANILPFPPLNSKFSHGDPVHRYSIALQKLTISLSVIIVIHYIVVFPLLVFYYCKILKHIKNLKEDYEGSTTTTPLYGATEAIIVKGHSKAKHRVFMFLTVFIVTGFCNLVIAFGLTITFSLKLSHVIGKESNVLSTTQFQTTLFVFQLVQSNTIPLQGFLNAIVYGWTREDFIYIMASTSQASPLKDPQINDVDHNIEPGEMSDLDSSCCESDCDQISPRNRQKTPETVLSDIW